MKKYIYIILLCSISYGDGVSIIGGFNYSRFIPTNQNNDILSNCDDCNWTFTPGLNVEVEYKVALFNLGLGWNRKITSFNYYDFSSTNVTREWNIDYFTFHGTIPVNLTKGFTIFGGLQYGIHLSSSEYFAYRSGNKYFTENISLDNDYGILIGTQLLSSKKIGLRASFYHGLVNLYDWEPEQFNGSVTISLIANYGKIGKLSDGGNRGPSAKPRKGSSKKSEKGSAPKRPAPLGNSQIDNFVKSVFDLNDKLLALKAKLNGVSSGLNESNAIMAEIGDYPDGPIAWASSQLAKGTSKAVNNLKSMNVSAGMDGLNPGQKLRSLLQTLKSGISDGKDELTTVPNDLTALANEATNLISSLTALPQAAKSLGLKAPKALKVIKTTSGVLKSIPNEVTSIGSEAKQVLSEIDAVLKNIQGLLGTK